MADAAVTAGVCESAVTATAVAGTVRIVVVQDDVLGGDVGTHAALPVAAGTAATIIRHEAMIVAAKSLILSCLVQSSPSYADE